MIDGTEQPAFFDALPERLGEYDSPWESPLTLFFEAPIKRKPWQLARIPEYLSLDAPISSNDKGVISRLQELAESRLETEALAGFKTAMLAFEKRATEAGLPPSEIDATYVQIERLLSAREEAALGVAERARLSAQILHLAASPMHVNQGDHNTCGSAILEVKAYWRRPSVAAKLVADVALTGHFQTGNGLTIEVDPSPHGTSKQERQADGQRSHASEIFQTAVIQLALRTRESEANKEGLVVYKQVEPAHANDSGERVVDYSTDPPRETVFEGLYVPDVIRANDILFGTKGDATVLWYSPRRFAWQESSNTFNDEQDLLNKLRELKRANQLPVALYVHRGIDPLWTESPTSANGGRGGYHFITVTDVSSTPPPEVAVDSTWWLKADHPSDRPMDLRDLFFTTLPPKEAERRLRQEVMANNTRGKPDAAKEVALIRLEWANGTASNEQLLDALREIVLVSSARWHRERQAETVDEREYQAAVEKILHAVDRLPYGDKLRMLKVLNGQRMMSAKDYDSAIAVTMIEMEQQRKMSLVHGDPTPAQEKQFESGDGELNKSLAELEPERQAAIRDQIRRQRLNDDSGFFAGRFLERRNRR
ncbi:MAG TPA: hypothetical protein V6D17_19265 [Candidatus Obscuribacterales bacterium]